MLLTLAFASLRRHRARTILAVLGVAVTGAMLLDMVMLATGMRQSFRDMILARGFELRIAPKGTLPFDTEATIGGASAITALLRAAPDIVAIAPGLGATVHVPRESGAVASFALGVDPRVQGDYELEAGRDPRASDEIVANAPFLQATGARLGDTLTLTVGYDPQLRTFTGRHAVRLVGRARFIYLSADQRAVAMPIGTLQAMGGPERADRVSLFMLRVRPGADAEQVRRWIAERLPRVTVLSTETAMQKVDERLSYFRQLSFILGGVSLVVGFLLVTTLVTVSVNERVGEIAVLRAIGVSRAHVVQQIVLESAALMLVGSALGLALGLVTARYLNAILSAFPGLPAAIDFFLFQPRAAWTALALLAGSGVVAGIYPAWRGASLPIAPTLRQEAVG